MSESNPGARKKRRRSAPLLWGSGLIAAAILVLGVNGTLSSWTTAIITNGTNTAGAGTAVALSETGPGPTGPVTCDTSTTTSNTINCSVNKYGGDTAMKAGDSTTVDVTFTNTGTGNASSLTLAPGACTDSAGGSLCTSGDLTVAVSCSDGATYASASAYTDLVWAAAAPGTQAQVVHTATIAPGAQITCQFTTTLLSTAPATDAGMSVSQPLVWTLQ